VATPHFYSASYTADLRAVINSLQQQYPRTPLVACGYSLGANILCRSASYSFLFGPLIFKSCCHHVRMVLDMIVHVNFAGIWVRRAVAHH
jgi:predicted alpha/beta-fold hydrolase